jgi:hypothetical protein
MRKRLFSYLGVGIVILALLPACEGQNDFVTGTAPAYSYMLGRRNVDIVNWDRDRLAIYFEECVVGKQDGSSIEVIDFHLYRSKVSDFDACVTYLGSFNFDDCFGNLQGLSVEDHIDSLQWFDTEVEPGVLDCSSGGHNKLILNVHSLWSSTAGPGEAMGYKLTMDESLESAEGDTSEGRFRMYFIVRDLDGSTDVTGPHVSYSYPANETGLTALPMPFPPHYPLNIVFNEPVLNVSLIPRDITWYYESFHAPYEDLFFPEVSAGACPRTGLSK